MSGYKIQSLTKYPTWFLGKKISFPKECRGLPGYETLVLSLFSMVEEILVYDAVLHPGKFVHHFHQEA